MKNKKAFTLVEALVAVVVIGIFMYAGLEIFMLSGRHSVYTEALLAAQSVAEAKMEETMAKPYDLISTEAQFDPYDSEGKLSLFSSRVDVGFVLGEDLNSSASEDKGYKKITVTVLNDLLTSPVTVESIRADY